MSECNESLAELHQAIGSRTSFQQNSAPAENCRKGSRKLSFFWAGAILITSATDHPELERQTGRDKCARKAVDESLELTESELN